MSVRAMSKVWERSRAKGSELLVLLAIADLADDEGRNAWPKVITLAGKSRMTERGVREVLRRLVEIGELEVEENRIGRVVRGGYRPRAFFHVLCCGGEAEKFSGVDGRPRRRRAEKFAGSLPEKISGDTEKIADGEPANFSAPTGTATYVAPEDGRTPLKEDPSVHTSTHTTRVREDGRRAHPLDEQPAGVVLEPWSVQLFDQLFEVYPRAEAKVRALRAWLELNPTREQGEFIVAHVRMRVADGWLKSTPWDKRPMLHTFLTERRFEERYAAPAAQAVSSREGLLVTRSCPSCGEVQEGCIRGGEAVYPACARCDQQRATA